MPVVLDTVVGEDEFAVPVRLSVYGEYLCTVQTGLNEELRELWEEQVEARGGYIEVDFDKNEPGIDVDVFLNDNSGYCIASDYAIPRQDGQQAFPLAIERVMRRAATEKTS